MKLKDKTIAFALTSSFYTFKSTINEMKKLAIEGANIVPIMSTKASTTNTKYGYASEFISKIEEITNKEIINTIFDAERVETDILVIAPCSRK